MKASSHIKDFRELFCEENSAHFVHSVIASFGHLQSRGKTWSSQRYFFIYKLLEALKESVLILSIWSVPSSEVKMQYELIYFSGIILSTQAPSLSCSCWCFLCPQICVPALLHIPSALPLLNSWEITNSPSDFLPILSGAEHLGCVEDGECTLEAKRKLDATSKCHANLYLFFNIYGCLITNVLEIRYEVPLTELLSGSVCIKVS